MDRVLKVHHEMELVGLDAGEELLNLTLRVDIADDELPFTVDLEWVGINSEGKDRVTIDAFKLTLREAKELMHALRYQIASLKRENASGA